MVDLVQSLVRFSSLSDAGAPLSQGARIPQNVSSWLEVPP